MTEFVDGGIISLHLTADTRTAVVTHSYKYGPPERHVIWRNGENIKSIHEFDAIRAVRALAETGDDDSLTRKLIVSIASQPGTDENGHEYPAGITVHD